jgi:hypothetical protein
MFVVHKFGWEKIITLTTVINFLHFYYYSILKESVFFRVRTGFGNIWKLIMDFSRTLKVLENGFLVH